MSEEAAQSSLFIPPAREFSVEPVFAFNSDEPQHELHPSFELNSLGISHSQQQEASSVLTSAHDDYSLQPLSAEDFLEIDDLIGTGEPTFGNIEKPVENSLFEEVDGLSELDLFHDAAMFLRDIGPLDEGNTIVPEMNPFNYGMVDGSNYQVQQNPLPLASESADQLWVHDQRGAAFTQSKSTEGAQLHPSGTGC